MSELRKEVKDALLGVWLAAPAPVRTDPNLIIDELVSAALKAVQGSLLADLGSASAAITAAELKVMNDCKPPDMGVGAMVS